MEPFTYTPAKKQAIGFTVKNAEAKAAHDSAQLTKPEAERVAYTLTPEQFAHAALDRVGGSYHDQILEAEGESAWDFVIKVVALKGTYPQVAKDLAALQASTAAAAVDA